MKGITWVFRIFNQTQNPKTNQNIEQLTRENSCNSKNLKSLNSHCSIDKEINKRVADSKDSHTHEYIRKPGQGLEKVQHIDHQLNKEL